MGFGKKIEMRSNTCYNLQRKRGRLLKTSEFVRQIKKQGVKFDSHGTNHDWYINPSNGQRTQVPRHPSKELKTKTVKMMLAQLGL